MNEIRGCDLCDLKLSESCVEISSKVYSYIDRQTATVCDLIGLANDALGGKVPQSLMSTINDAVDGVNRYYDECAFPSCSTVIGTADPDDSVTRDLFERPTPKAKGVVVIWPNPVEDLLFVQLTVGKSMETTIEIFDVVGERHYASSANVEKGKSLHKVWVDNLESGFYLIRVKTDKEYVTQQFVKIDSK